MDEETKTMNEVVAAIQQALDSLKFGSIEITVHDGKVVQIERKEKIRVGARCSLW